MQRTGWSSLAALPILLLASCSPYSYSKEVAAVSASVDKMAAAYSDGYAAVAADRAALVRLQLATARAPVLLPTDCASAATVSTNEPPCEPYAAGGALPAPTGIEARRKTAMAALTVLQDYAHGLAAVTNAADRDAYDAAVGQLAGAVGALARNADAAAPGISTVAPATINLLGWLVGTALDQQRFATLKAVTTAMEGPDAHGLRPVRVVAKSLATGLVALRGTRLRLVDSRARRLAKGLGPSLSQAAYESRLDSLQAATTVLESLRQVNPDATADALAAAHTALVAAVNSPTPDSAALLAAISDFADKAAALRSALAASAKAGK